MFLMVENAFHLFRVNWISKRSTAEQTSRYQTRQTTFTPSITFANASTPCNPRFILPKTTPFFSLSAYEHCAQPILIPSFSLPLIYVRICLICLSLVSPITVLALAPFLPFPYSCTLYWSHISGFISNTWIDFISPNWMHTAWELLSHNSCRK